MKLHAARWKLRRMRLLQLVSGLLAIGTAILAIFDGAAKSLSWFGHEVALARLISIPLCVILLSIYIFATYSIRRLLYPDTSLGAPRFPSAQSGDIADFVKEIRTVAQRYDKEALSFFADCLLFQSLYTVRAIEEAVIEEGALRLDTTVTFSLPGYLWEKDVSDSNVRAKPRVSSLVVPLVRAKKGALLDNLEIEDEAGSSLPSLSQEETKALLANVVCELYWKSYIDPTKPFNVKGLNQEQQWILGLILAGVRRIGRIEDVRLDAMRLILNEHSQAAHPELARLLADLMEFVTQHYIVAVEAPCPNRRFLILRHAKNLPLFEQDTRFKDRWRLRFGLRPYRFTIPLWWPFAAESYHFRMRGPAGQYVNDHYLFRVETDDHKMAVPVRQADFTDYKPRPYLRVRYHGGLPYAHFYARKLNTVRAFDLCTRVEFFETPPGTLGGAAAVSVATAVLISIFTLIGVTRSQVTISSDLPALLLAAPGLAASFLGFASDNESLLRTSLSARLGLMASGFMSFGSALLYVVQVVRRLVKPDYRFSLFDGLVHLRHINLWWVLLSISSAACSIYLLCVLTARTHRYVRDLRRKGVLDNPYLANSYSGERRGNVRISDPGA